ncbi:MAG: hypothetical protein IKO32_07035 [Lachnospiraceae bacterium]|nr:hypothetical protein [Lachnospiraceae bacterium]
MLEVIKQMLEEEYQLTDVNLDTDFKKDLGLNSFDFLNLICLFEEKYNVELDEEKYRNMSTIGELCEYLESLVGSNAV